MRNCVGAAVVLTGLLTGTADAQQQIEWKQVINTAKGANLPKDVKGDILGIELGESFASARPKLEALKKDGGAHGLADEPIWREFKTGMRSGTHGGTWIDASYPGMISLSRSFKGTGELPVGMQDEVSVVSSAPSSGSQVVSIRRTISITEKKGQVRISDLVKDLTDKFKSAPQITKQSSQAQYWWQFNDGKAFAVKGGQQDPFMCWGKGMPNLNEEDVVKVNPNGQCDVLLEVMFNFGISEDHAASIIFELTDLERTKANLTADYGFFKTYTESFIKGTSGARPKL